MKEKKTKKADLEKQRGLFLEIGFAVALLITFLSFQWKTGSGKVKFTTEELAAAEETIEIARFIEEPPKLEKIKVPQKVNLIEIIDDEEEVDDEDILDDIVDDMIDDKALDLVIDSGEEEESDDNQIFVKAEKMPIFQKGSLMRYIMSRIKYPILAQENDITGTVYISFVVNKNGEVINVKVLRGVDPSLNKEAIRVIKALPNWIPGYQRTRPVNVAFTVPIKFELQ